MTKMQEVASAILRAELERESASLLAAGKVADARALAMAIESAVEKHWQTRRDEARAAIEALREVPDKIYEAGRGQGGTPEDIWPAMLNAILSEGE